MEPESKSHFSTSEHFYLNSTFAKESNRPESPQFVRTHRIFRDESPRESENRCYEHVSPTQKLSGSTATYDTRVAYSPQGCTLYYNEGIGISPPRIRS